MRKLCNMMILGSLLTATSLAGPHGAPGYSLADSCSLSGKMESFDPYARFLPSIDTTSFELSSSYSIQLQPLRADDMSQYQFRTVDNRGLGAGYSSPYLWETGRGPGGGFQTLGPGSWSQGMDRRSFSPIPLPGR